MKTVIIIAIGFVIFNLIMFVIGLVISFKYPTVPTYKEHKPVTEKKPKVDRTGEILDVTVKTLFFPLYAIHLVGKCRHERKKNRKSNQFFLF